MGEVVRGNKDWYRLSEFKGRHRFGYESRQSVTTSDLLPEAPAGCRDVIVLVAVSDSAWPPLSSICITSIYFVVVLCAHKLLSFLHSLSVLPIHSWQEQSCRFMGRTWPYCVRMWGWEKRGIGSVIEKAIRATVWQRGQRGGQRTGDGTFSSFRQLHYSCKGLCTETVAHPLDAVQYRHYMSWETQPRPSLKET